MQFIRLPLISLLLMGLLTGLPLQAQRGNDPAGHYLERARHLYNRSLYDSLPWYYRNAMKIYREREDPGGIAECLLGMSEYYRLNNELEESGAYLDKAMEHIASRIGKGTEAWSDALYVRAKLLLSRNRLQEALDAGGDCLALRLDLKVPREKIARTWNVMGSIYHSRGNYPEAERHYLLAYDYFIGQSDGPTLEKGWLQYNLAVVYMRMEEMQRWLTFTKRAIENNRALYGEDFPDLAASYNWLSNYYIANGKIDSAEYYLDRAEDLYIRVYGRDYHRLDEIYTNRARIHTLEGNYFTALEYYRETERIQSRHNLGEGYRSYIRYINTAYLHRQLGEFEQAQKYYDRLPEAGNKVHPARLADFCQYNAINLTALGKFDAARDCFERLFQLRQAHFPEHHISRAADMRSYGELLDSLGRHQEAGDYFLRSVEIMRKNFGDLHRSTAFYLKYTGDHFFRMGDAGRALAYYQESLYSLVPGYDQGDPAANPGVEEVQDQLFFLGLLKQKSKSLEMLASGGAEEEYLIAAFNALRLSVRLTGSLRTSYLSDRSKLYLSENERSTYEDLVRIAHMLYTSSRDPLYLDEAFRTAEKSKYATLVSVLQRSSALELAGIPDSVRQQEYTLRKELSVNRELLREARSDTLVDSSRLEKYRSAVFQLSDRLETLNRKLEEAYPDYYNLLYNQPVTDTRTVKKRLDRHEKLFEYFMTTGELYIFEISSGSSSFRRVPLDRLLEDLKTVDRYLKVDYLTDSLEVSHQAFLDAAYRLREVLVPGVRKTEKLLFIPEGPLAYFPFDILLAEPVDNFGGDFSKVPFLIRDHSLHYAYSATLMDHTSGRRHKPAKTLVAFAPVYDQALISRAKRDARRDLQLNHADLEPLPGTLREVTEIGKLTGGQAFTGIRASESCFRENANSADVIHLATHAFLDDEDPLASRLVFTDDARTGEDGFLHTFEIYNLDLQASLVALSACNTGLGLLKGGEGIMSLARAFLYAGVPSIVMTLWTVSDEQSYRLMLRFYEYLLLGRSPSVALRRAKLDMLNESSLLYRHPRFWAGYITVGRDESVFLDKTFVRNFSAITAAVIFLILILKGKTGKKKRRNQVRSS